MEPGQAATGVLPHGRQALGAALTAAALLAALPAAALPGSAPPSAPPGVAHPATAVADVDVSSHLFAARPNECRHARGPFDAATRDDAAFNATFRHAFAKVDGVTMHYVVGGHGDHVMVLLPGWPQSWFEFYDVMFDLARSYTVIAVDLPGLGDSRGAPPSYDKATLARYVHGLVSTRLGHRNVDLVGHDLGAGVAFQYAAQNRGEVAGLVVMDYEMPGPAVSAAFLRAQAWWFAFHQVPGLPEQLISGRQRTYQSWFYDNLSGGRGRVTPRAVDEYVRTACEPAKLSGGLDLYRTLDADEAANRAVAANPLTIPVRTLSASTGPTAVPGGVASALQPLVATPVSNIAIPDSGHWLAEENPTAVVAELRRFFPAG